MTESYLRWQLEKKSVHRPFDFDVYYPLIKDHTWASRIIPFSPNLAQACVNYYQARFNNRTSTLRPGDVELLRDLERSLDDVMSASSSTSFFIRMSNRSPKDGFPLEASKLSRKFQSELSKIESSLSVTAPVSTAASASASVAATSASTAPPSSESDDEDPLLTKYSANDIMVAYSGAQSSALCVSTGREAMCLLLTSERVYRDLHLALDCSVSPTDEWNTYLIVREWDDDLRHDLEFRCFVHDNHLCAISQYNHYCVFDSVLTLVAGEGRKQLIDEIVAYWRIVRNSLKHYDSYVLDVARLGPGRWCTIELNPFARSTGGCLFDWNVDDDALHGRNAADRLPELRVLDTAHDHLADMLRAAILPTLHKCINKAGKSDEDWHVTSGPWDEFLCYPKPQESPTSVKRTCIIL